MVRSAIRDPFRVKYRRAITGQVAEIIRARCGRREAVARLRRWAEESVARNPRLTPRISLQTVAEAFFQNSQISKPRLRCD